MKAKKLLIITILLLGVIVICNNVFGFSNFNVNNVNQGASTTGESIETANTAVSRIWNTVVLILQILAVAAIVIAGIRYMFASADGKADIKKQTIGLIVGAILVFAATSIINFIVSVTKEVTGESSGNVTNAVIYNGSKEPANGRHSDYDNDGFNDWGDYLKVENNKLVSGNDGIPDIYQQDTNGNGKCDYEDMWLPTH